LRRVLESAEEMYIAKRTCTFIGGAKIVLRRRDSAAELDSVHCAAPRVIVNIGGVSGALTKLTMRLNDMVYPVHLAANDEGD